MEGSTIYLSMIVQLLMCKKVCILQILGTIVSIMGCGGSKELKQSDLTFISKHTRQVYTSCRILSMSFVQTILLKHQKVLCHKMFKDVL